MQEPFIPFKSVNFVYSTITLGSGLFKTPSQDHLHASLPFEGVSSSSVAAISDSCLQHSLAWVTLWAGKGKEQCPGTWGPGAEQWEEQMVHL